MSQGYPHGQAPNPYAQPPNGYQQPPNPYGQPQAPYGQPPPNAYQQPQQVQYQQPETWSQAPQPPYGQAPVAVAAPYPPQSQPAAGGQGPRLPEQADGLLRGFGGFLDFVIAAVGGFLLARALLHAGPKTLGMLVIAILAIPFISFANQVVLARLTGCSIGKFLMATRVINTLDGRRPTVRKLTVRWFIAGVLGWLVFIISLWLDSDTSPSSRNWVSPFSSPEDGGDIRIVRRKHLRELLG